MNAKDIESLWARGRSHSISAKCLAVVAEMEARNNNHPDIKKAVFNGQHSASIHLLVGYSFELFLKCAYLLNGGQLSRLKAIGHDLVAALDGAEMLGFKSIHPKLGWSVEALNATHVSHHFRYGTRPSISLPELKDSFEILDTLENLIAPQIYK